MHLDYENHIARLRTERRCMEAPEPTEEDYARVPAGIHIMRANYVDGLLDLIDYAKPSSVIEIGSNRGVSTEAFLLHCDLVASVDPWPDEAIFEDFKSRCASYGHLLVYRGRSPEAVDALDAAHFDLAYIDAEHTPEAVAADIKAALRVVKPGGWLAGHDFFDTPDTINSLVGKVDVFADTSWLARAPTGEATMGEAKIRQSKELAAAELITRPPPTDSKAIFSSLGHPPVMPAQSQAPPFRKVMIAIPSGTGRPGSQTMVSCLNAMSECAAMGWLSVIVTRDCDSLLTRARDVLLSQFWASDATDIVCVDDDISWPPGTFLKLLSHPVDFVGGVYRGRGDPPTYVCVPVDSRGINISYPSGLAEVRGVGTGFLRLTKAAVKLMIDAMPEGYWYRDQVTGDLKVYHFFDVTFDPTEPDPTMRLRSEDYVLCDRYRAAGGRVYADTELTLAHRGHLLFEGHFGNFLKSGAGGRVIAGPQVPAKPASLLDAAQALIEEAA